MNTVPETYYQFIMDYAPYTYVIPPDTPDQEWGRSAFAAAFAINFLSEAYHAPQFENRKTEILNKITTLADFILTQQCTDNNKQAYGGFKSAENSTYYYTIDACRTIPALLKAYELTQNTTYHETALRAATFLYNMQQKPSQQGIHDKYYGGFARATTIEDNWLPQMDIEHLYALTSLKQLCTADPQNQNQYQTMMADALNFYRQGIQNFHLYYDPPPNGDGKWHRIGTAETQIYDDSFAYALYGLYEYEGWSPTCQKIYHYINAINASPNHPAYNPAICWAGYIDITNRTPACNYYDSVTAGILWQIRKNHDKPSLAYSMKIISKHQEEFMYWGVKHEDYGFVENKKAMATVCWLALFFLNYEEPTTRFTQILRSNGETLTLYPIKEAAEKTSYGEPVEIQAITTPTRTQEILLEPGYTLEDYITLHTFTPLRLHDKICVKGEDYQVISIQPFHWKNQTAYYKASLRRLATQ